MSGPAPVEGAADLERVQVLRVAVFGKQEQHGDYRWSCERERVPACIDGLFEALAGAAERGHARLAAVVVDEAGTWLARTFDDGIDGAWRPVPGVELSRLVAPDPLRRVDWLRLAWSACQPADCDRADLDQQVELVLPTILVSARPAEARAVARARLGLAASVSPSAALHLLGEAPSRLRGVVYALGPERCTLRAPSESAGGLLLVGLECPADTEVERGLLERVERLDLGPAEWRALIELPLPLARVGLGWAAGSEDGALSGEEFLKLADFLTLVRRRSHRGAALVERLRQDAGGAPLPPSALALLGEGLSAGALEILGGQRAAPDLVTVGELVAGGFLPGPGILPLADWFHHAALDPRIARAAIAALTGIGEPAARVALGLAAPRAPTPGEFAQGVEAGAKAGLPVPMAALRRWIEGGRPLLPLLPAVQGVGGAAAAMVRLAQGGALPAPGVCSADDLALAALAWGRAEGVEALLDSLAALVGQGREAEAGHLVAVAAGLLPSADAALLGGRLGLPGQSPSTAPPPASWLPAVARLAVRGLLGPADLSCPEGPRALAALARCWPSLAPLAELLEGRAPLELPEVPDPWRPAIASALSPAACGRWVTGLSVEQREAAREWLVEVGAAPPWVIHLGAPCAELPRPADLAQGRAWIDLAVSGASLEDRLALVGALAPAIRSQGDEALAECLVDRVLAEQSEAGRSLALHVLTGLGPMPPLCGVAVPLLIAWVGLLDPAALVDALLVLESAWGTSEEALIQAVVGRVHRCGAGPSRRAWLRRQLRPAGSPSRRIPRSARAGWLGRPRGWRCRRARRTQVASRCPSGRPPPVWSRDPGRRSCLEPRMDEC